jgi:uncharacterized Zn-finger protein
MDFLHFIGVMVEEAPAHIVPKCPYCQKKLKKIWTKSKGVLFMVKKQLVICPHCETLLGTFSK